MMLRQLAERIEKVQEERRNTDRKEDEQKKAAELIDKHTQKQKKLSAASDDIKCLLGYQERLRERVP